MSRGRYGCFACLWEWGLHLVCCVNSKRQDAETGDRIYDLKSNEADITKSHRMFPAGMDLLFSCGAFAGRAQACIVIPCWQEAAPCPRIPSCLTSASGSPKLPHCCTKCQRLLCQSIALF